MRKHIFNKHAEKIEEVKKEVAFFNNFLMDAKRPALPEFKLNQPPVPGQGESGGGRPSGPCRSSGSGRDPSPASPRAPLATCGRRERWQGGGQGQPPLPAQLVPPSLPGPKHAGAPLTGAKLCLPLPSSGLAPGLPYPPQAPQGLMPYGQPRPPILGYGGT